jgi:hypothetical protein
MKASHILLLSMAAATLPTGAATRLRYGSYLVCHAKAGERIALRVRSLTKAQFTYKDAPRIRVIDPDSRPVATMSMQLGETLESSVTAEKTGLHAVCIQSGSNLVEAEIIDRPWALVARHEAPLNISGMSDAWYFAPPADCPTATVFVHAPVKGEAAIVEIRNPAGELAVREESDFDQATALETENAKPESWGAWRLDIRDPAREDFALDDVKVWLDPGLQPLLCPRAEWLATFKGVTGEPPEKITARVVIHAETLALRKGASEEIAFDLTTLPQTRLTALRARATDVDYGKEAPCRLNAARFFLPVTGDGVTTDVTVKVAPGVLRVGRNVLRLKQDPSGGSGVYSVHRVELLFGDAINVE